MFLPWFSYNSCCGNQSNSTENYRQRKIKFLKFVRDELETRLAAVNAAIETAERQNNEN